MSKYNGWTNWATWNCNLWLTNDYNDYKHYSDLARYNDAYELSKIIESDIDSLIENTSIDGFLLDMLNGSISEINFYEIAEHFTDEVEDEDEDESEKKAV